MSKNYEVHLIKWGSSDPDIPLFQLHAYARELGYHPAYFLRSFHYRSNAIELANEVCSRIEKRPVVGTFWCQVVNLRTGKAIHMLPKNKSKCRACGNELEGKIHCPLCNAAHYYR